MKIKIYKSFDDFELNYLDDFNKQEEHSYLSYLNILHKGYDECLHEYFTNSVKKINDINEQFMDSVDEETRENTTREVHNLLVSKSIIFLEILKYIQLEKERQKTIIKMGKKIEPDPEPEPLSTKQIQKVGLFKRAGIINFLKEKNPKLTPSQMAKFLRELTSEHLENSESVRPHITEDLNSNKHPFYNNGSKEQIDNILSIYKIFPQSEK
jgi:ribosomal protein L31